MDAPFGENIKLYIEGGSHSEKISLRLSGIPAGVKIESEGLREFLKRRSPRNPWDTPRKEEDMPVFEGGIKDGVTDGDEIRVSVYNRNVNSGDYEKFSRFPRPSHGDYPALVKYGSDENIPGGGRFSGRMTLLTAIAGYIAGSYLKAFGIEIFAHIYSVGEIKDTPFDPVAPENRPYSHPTLAFFDEEKGKQAERLLAGIREERDSVGGVIECAVTGLPVGLGEHMYASVESAVSQAVFGIPAVKGIEFGSGFACAEMRGSVHNDPYYFDGDRVKTRSNNAGGILGGMTTGMPVIFRIALKPTPSIGLEQDTVDLKTGENGKLTISGRHDACVVPRAVPVTEAAAALAFADLLIGEQRKKGSLEALRNEIDFIDTQIVSLLNSRLEVSKKIGIEKRKIGKAVFDPEREKQLLNRLTALGDGDNKELVKAVYELVLENSKKVQRGCTENREQRTVISC